jgi:serine/threonine protein kinase
MTLPAGARLGPYEILDLVGAGGMGEVYRARDPRLGRDVAIKVLPDEVGAGPERLRRFEQEARAVAALSHPNILTVFDVGSHPSADAPATATPYVVMELLEGETLREVVSRRSPSQRQVLSFGVQVARGLEAAHAKGIVHRDVKPENVFVTSDGRVKLLDFGLAKQLDRLTAGSDARTDVFSFGVLLYELLSGKHPFRGGVCSPAWRPPPSWPSRRTADGWPRARRSTRPASGLSEGATGPRATSLRQVTASPSRSTTPPATFSSGTTSPASSSSIPGGVANRVRSTRRGHITRS